MSRAVLMAALLLLFGGCSVSSTKSETEDKRYRECIEAGGSYWTDDADWGCDTGEGKP